MQNPLTRTPRLLAVMARDMAVGANKFGSTIGLTVVDEAALRAKAKALDEAIVALGQARTELTTRLEKVRELMKTSRAFLVKARDSLKSSFGNQCNPNWHVTGFVRSLVVPRTELPVVGLLHLMKGFLKATPEFELEVRGITSVQAGLLLTQLEAARGAVNLQAKLVKDRLNERNAKVKVLRKAMRDMIRELTCRLDPMDNHWVAFRLKRPGAKETPDAPTEVKAVQVLPNTLSVEWKRAPRAEFYRVRMKVKDVDQEMVVIGKASDRDFMIENVPTNAEVEVAVSAVNNGGESPLSEIVVVTVRVMEPTSKSGDQFDHLRQEPDKSVLYRF